MFARIWYNSASKYIRNGGIAMKRGLTLALAWLFVLGLAMPTASMEAEDISSGVDDACL